MSEKTRLIVCPACAAVRSDSGRVVLVCPECGFRLGRARYDRMIEAARDAARLGHVYREVYKRDKGAEHRDYYIGVDDALVFAALAALSGVIGNATYDAIKAFIARLKKQGVNPKLAPPQINLFIQNVRNYHIEQMSATHTQIIEPLMRDFAEKKLWELAEGAEQRGESEFARRLREAADDARKHGIQNVPRPADFANVASRATPKRPKKRKMKRRRRSGA